MKEEAGVIIQPKDVTEFMVHSANDNRLVLIFGLAKPMKSSELHPIYPK